MHRGKGVTRECVGLRVTQGFKHLCEGVGVQAPVYKCGGCVDWECLYASALNEAILGVHTRGGVPCHSGGCACVYSGMGVLLS